jgi:hypothetical protein
MEETGSSHMSIINMNDETTYECLETEPVVRLVAPRKPEGLFHTHFVIENTDSIDNICANMEKLFSTLKINRTFYPVDLYWEVNHTNQYGLSAHIHICVFSFITQENETKYVIEAQRVYGDRETFYELYKRLRGEFVLSLVG